MKIFSYLLIVLILIVGIAFSILNSQSIALNYIFGTSHLPLSLLMVIVFAIGFVFCALVLGVVILKQKSKVRKLKKALATAEKEIENLRVMPVKDR